MASGTMDFRSDNSRVAQMTVRVYEGERFASLGRDLAVMDDVLFVAGVSEFIEGYADFRTGGVSEGPYRPALFHDLDDALARLGPKRLDPSILFDEPDELEAVFRRLLSQRRGGYYAIGSDEGLRIEAVELWKENPTSIKILVAASATFILTMGGVYAYGGTTATRNIAACQENVMGYADRRSQALEKQMKLEGRTTDQHVEIAKDINRTYAAGIAACGAFLKEPYVTIQVKGDVTEGEAGATFEIGFQDHRAKTPPNVP